MTINLDTPPHRILAAFYRGTISERSLHHDLAEATAPDAVASVERAFAIIDATLTLPTDDPDQLAEIFQSGQMTRRQLEALARTRSEIKAVTELFTLRPVQ